MRWLCLALVWIGLSAAATPPQQPAAGPGGSDLPHHSVRKQRFESGSAEYWIYEPEAPRPKTAPVVVFSHGWGAMNPVIYGAWIDHIVRRGNIVVYPRYQADLRTPVREFTPNVLTAVRRALAFLESTPGHVRPDRRAFALVGHSMGGIVTANVAALAVANGLPAPGVVMCVEPGKTTGVPVYAAAELEDLSRIPASALLIAMAGEDDRLAADTDARRIFTESTSVRPANKNFVLLRSDDHGSPRLNANHGAPSAPDPAYDNGERRNARWSAEGPSGYRGTNALDYYGTWKLFDALCDAAFRGIHREFALGNTPEQRFMGRWSDGVGVRELEVIEAR